MTTPADPLLRAAAELSPHYGKTEGVLVATGQAATELGLELAGVRPGDEVIVPSNCCYLVPVAVARCGAQAVFAGIGPRLVLEAADVARALTARTVAVIAVHHLGLPCAIGELRAVLPKRVVVIEDAAQAYDLQSRGDSIGTHADFVVASFGPGKPLCLGGGGGLFGTRRGLKDAMERYGRRAREGGTLPRSYALHPSAVANLAEAIETAAGRLQSRREVVRWVEGDLRQAGFRIWTSQPGDRPSWHRLPVWPMSGELRSLATDLRDSHAVVQTVHDIPTASLPMFPSSRGFEYSDLEEPLLLRTDEPASLLRWTQELMAATR